MDEKNLAGMQPLSLDSLMGLFNIKEDDLERTKDEDWRTQYIIEPIENPKNLFLTLN